MEEPHPSSASSSATFMADGSSSLPSSAPSSSQVQEEENEENNENQNLQPAQQTSHQRRSSVLPYRVNTSISETTASEMRDDVWSCLLVLVTFWFFGCVTLILGFYGSSNLQLGPNCSRLIQTNPFFVQSVMVEGLEGAKPGPVLYGFYEPPPLDVELTWTETHNTFEWIYFLNKGSRIDVLFDIKSPSSPPLLLVITKGKESLVEWIEDPSYPNITTLSWNVIHGSGKIQHEIPESSSYFIAVGNLNSEEVEVELEFNIKALLYNTTNAHFKCLLGNHLCSLKLSILGAKTAVLTSPAHNEDSPAGDDWYVKLSYGPRWLLYLISAGLMTVIILVAFRFCNKFQNGVVHRGEPERAPLLLPKDDDVSSWGSSYDSLSHEEEDPEESQLAECSLEGNAATNEGEKNHSTKNPRRICVICFDSPRDCFFLPCGHCAACFTCGTRYYLLFTAYGFYRYRAILLNQIVICRHTVTGLGVVPRIELVAEEAGTCPICRRKIKKVRKIFSV
ncbi:Zinc finger, RING/FYVE/PHD-type [Trema orientale]|uniref:Zinc finger, RING/FYVE/PHD-type n=1 Tax=Trema orientale TaxID=63057 RepID=A0A2P5EIV6_TREOI|nr:Zinc finger, RING/FYVE/PHD-type [Trema orientale]